MTSSQFFGRGGKRDVDVTLYNDKGEAIYHSANTEPSDAHLTIKDTLEFAIQCYYDDWKDKGEPVKAVIWTTPKYNECTIDITTGKQLFRHMN